MIPKETKLILLDFGNVVINIDLDRTFQAFSDITGKSIEKIVETFEQDQLFRRYESGHFSTEDFREIVRQALGFPFSDAEINHAWGALLLDVPKHRVDLILELRQKYDVRLLSNTNALHIEMCDAYFNKHFGIPAVKSLFNTAYYSFDLGTWKPEKEIYMQVLNHSGYAPEQIYFVDDNLSNIKGAAALGIKTLHLIPPDDIVNHLSLD